MKQIFVMFALLLGVCAANAQETDTVKYAAGNDLYRGITRKLPYRQMVTPYGVEVTFEMCIRDRDLFHLHQREPDSVQPVLCRGRGI